MERIKSFLSLQTDAADDDVLIGALKELNMQDPSIMSPDEVEQLLQVVCSTRNSGLHRTFLSFLSSSFASLNLSLGNFSSAFQPRIDRVRVF